jgi:murein DD-endopeptidase MepM/ murein hydrolase activator NlpD
LALFTDRDHRLVGSARPVAAALVLVAMLSAALLISLLASVIPAPDTAQAASRSQLNTKLDNVRSELEEVKANIEKATNAKKAAQGDIAALDQNIAGAEEELGAADAAHDAAAEKLVALQGQLDQLASDLTAKQEELVQTESDVATQEEIFGERLVNAYKSDGGIVYLQALLESDSLADVVGRARLIGDIVEQDNNMLAEIKALKALMEEQKLALETQRTSVAILEHDQADATAELQVAVEQRQAAVDELESARAAKKKVLKAAEKDEAAWKAQEDDLLAESKRIAELLKAASAAKTVKKGSGVLAWPVIGAVTSGYGYRIHPIFNVRRLHTGIDIDADMGDAIKAAAGGTVVSADWRGGYGKCVVISHGGGLATLYGHMSVIGVSAGDTVKRGEVIGKVGSTGYSTGPHLHFEVRVNGDPVDPLGYL